MEPDKRLELVAKIVRVATTEYGIAIEDIVIDPLAMPIGADTSHRADDARDDPPHPRRVRPEHDPAAASNVSFGMPGRHTLGATFLPIAMSAGLTSAIMDTRTPQIVEAVKAADLLLNHDEWGMTWIAAHRAKQAAGGMTTDRPYRRPRPAVGRPRQPAPRGPASTGRPAGRRSRATPAPRRHRPGRADPAARRAHRPRAARASPCSTAPAGTASPSTRPAAATAPARSARCRSPSGRCRCRGSTRGRSPPTSCATAGGSPAWRRRRGT